MKMGECQFCNVGLSKYTCPKCGLAYCSSECYQSEAHSKCSEEFYKNCVKQELNLRSKEDKDENERKIHQILKNQFERDDDDELLLDSDDELDLADRLEGVDLDDGDRVWQKLTEEEKKDFNRLVENGEISKFLPKFEPFWNHYKKEPLVKVLTGDDDNKNDDKDFESVKKRCPKVEWDKIPKFESISPKEPHFQVKFGLVNVLGAYAASVRKFNGNHREHRKEFNEILLKLSKNLGPEMSNFESVDLAVQSVILNLPQDLVSLNGLIESDAMKLLRGPSNDKERKNYYILSALSDIKKCLKNKSKCGKKIEYYLSWTLAYSHELDLMR